MITAATSSNAGAQLGVVLLIIIAIALYWLPTFVAWLRHHHQLGAIAVINFLAGWTFVGWIVAMAMACCATKKGGVPVAVVQMPAGWYPDPSDAELMRWWDGDQWTGASVPRT